MKLSDSDVKFIDEAYAIVRKGHYPDGAKLKEVYMRCLSDEISSGKYKSNLSQKCGSCLKVMAEALYKEKQRVFKMIGE